MLANAWKVIRQHDRKTSKKKGKNQFINTRKKEISMKRFKGATCRSYYFMDNIRVVIPAAIFSNNAKLFYFQHLSTK